MSGGASRVQEVDSVRERPVPDADIGLQVLEWLQDILPSSKLDPAARTLKVRRLHSLVTIRAGAAEGGRSLLRQSFAICRYPGVMEDHHRFITSVDGEFRLTSAATLNGRTLYDRASVTASDDDERFAGRLLYFMIVTTPVIAFERALVLKQVLRAELLGADPSRITVEQAIAGALQELELHLPQPRGPGWYENALAEVEEVFRSRKVAYTRDADGLVASLPNERALGWGLIHDDGSGALQLKVSPMDEPTRPSGVRFELELPYFPRAFGQAKDGEAWPIDLAEAGGQQLWPVHLNALEWSRGAELYGNWTVQPTSDAAPRFVFGASSRLGRVAFRRAAERMLERAIWIGPRLYATAGMEDFQKLWARRPME